MKMLELVLEVGDAEHFFVIKLISFYSNSILVYAKSNNVKLSYSTFGDQNYKNKLEKLLSAVIKYTPKVCDLYKLLIDFKGNTDKEFHKYLKEKLGDEFYMEEEMGDLFYKLFMNSMNP